MGGVGAVPCDRLLHREGPSASRPVAACTSQTASSSATRCVTLPARVAPTAPQCGVACRIECSRVFSLVRARREATAAPLQPGLTAVPPWGRMVDWRSGCPPSATTSSSQTSCWAWCGATFCACAVCVCVCGWGTAAPADPRRVQQQHCGWCRGCCDRGSRALHELHRV